MGCKPILRDVPQQTQSDTSEPARHFLPNGEPRPAVVHEQPLVLGTPAQAGLVEDDHLERYPAIEADHFRKRVTKHRTLEEARVLTLEFLTACNRNGISRPAAEDIWDGKVETAANIWPLAGSFADFLRGFGPRQEDDGW